MAKFTVSQGKRYRATIRLAFFDLLVSNDMIAMRLRALGFADVGVTGSGTTRVAEALWPGPDATVEMPSQTVDMLKI
jgi:hypothetical protein